MQKLFFIVILISFLNYFPVLAVEVSADIPANPINTLVKQLQQREEQLKQRELSLQQTSKDDLNFYLLIIIGLATIANFYLDFRRLNK